MRSFRVGPLGLLTFAASAHVTAVAAYFYAHSPILGFLAFVLSVWDIYVFLARQK